MSTSEQRGLRVNDRQELELGMPLTGTSGHILHVVLKYLNTAANVGQWDGNVLVESTRSYESATPGNASEETCASRGRQNLRVKRFWEVGRGNDDDALILQETVHLHQKLVESLLHVVLITARPLATDCVQLVNEDDGRLLLACGGEEVANTLRTNTHEHLIKL